jgi:hypothetical protein
MAYPKHLAKLKEGAEAWNTWRVGHPDVIPNLARANGFPVFTMRGKVTREGDFCPLTFTT